MKHAIRTTPPHAMRPFASRLALVVALLLTAGAALAPAFAQPTNDDFANAVLIDPVTLPATVTGTNVGATSESGEIGGRSPRKTVWWRITPTADGDITVDTEFSNFDTVLTVLTGASVSNLTQFGFNDDTFGLQSKVTFAATASRTYYIQVDGFESATGSITLNVDFTPVARPPNDAFADAVALDVTTLPATATGTNVDASTEPGETGGSSPRKTVWWRITPTTNFDLLEVYTDDSDLNTYLSVFTGTSVDNLTLVDEDDDGGEGRASFVSFPATAGETYYIQVDGFSANTDSIALTVDIPRPDNDALADAVVIDPSTLPFTTTGTNVDATGESSEPGGNGALNTVWWRITPTADGDLKVNTFGSDFDTVLSIFTGTSVDDLTALTANDNAGGGSQSEVTFAAAASTTYYIQVDGAGMGTGNITLNTAPGPQITDVAPATVRPGDAIRITGANFPDRPSVTIGGVSAAVTSASSTEVVATVPDGSTGGTVEIGVADSPEPLRVHDAPYGPETALAFDGDGDELDVGTGIRLDNRSFSIDFWAKRAATGLLHYVIGQGAAQTTNQSLHVGFEDDDQFEFAFYGNDLRAPAFASTDWHHWTVTYDHTTGARTIYRDGTAVASDTVDPSSAAYAGTGALRIGRVAFQDDWHFRGELDQVRFWNIALTEAEIRERMHRTILPSEAVFGDLAASYRFDAGSDTTAYDYAGANSASFEGDPQWTAFSPVPVGQQSALATPGTSALVGPRDARLLVSGVSAGAVQLYRYGQSDGPVRDGSAPGDDLSGVASSERSNLTWGLATPDGAAPEADVTIEYTLVEGLDLSGAAGPVLLRRDAPGDPWLIAPGWTYDAAGQTFAFSGPVPTGEYALATLPYADLAVSITPPAPTLPGESATFTVTLTNAGPGASASAAVDFTTSATLGTLTPGTPSSGSVSGTTWTVGALASGQGATLEITAPFAGPEPGTLTATATDTDSFDPQASNDAGTAIVTTLPYGAETALSFDGTDDVVGTPFEQPSGPFTAEAWIKPTASGAQGIINRDSRGSDGDFRSWKLGLDSDGQTLRFDVFSDGSTYETAQANQPLAFGQWHHVAGVYDGTNLTVYVNGAKAGEQPFGAPNWNETEAPLRIGTDACCDGRDFDGQIDQVRIWKAALTEAEVRARMHRTIASTDAAFSDLIASYRFDVGTGTTAYDYAGSNPATFQGDPQWTAFSGANVGQTSAVATSSTDASIGPAGAQLSATGASGDVQLYRFGTADGPLRSASAPGEGFGGVSSERSNLTWGLATPDGTAPTADLTLDYSGAPALPSGDVTLVRRDRPGDPWTFASGWGHDKGNQRFLFSGTVPTGEYAIADVPPPQVTTNTGLTLSQGTFAAITQAMLKTSDPNDAPGTLEYTVTSGPTSGQLLLFGEPLGGGGPSGFTQRLINDGQVIYVSDGTTGTDTFDFEVTDGVETITGTFTVNVEANPAYGASGSLAFFGEGDSGPRPVGDTGLLLDVQTVAGFSSGSVHVVRYDDAPANAESIDLPNLGTSRYVITTLGGLQVDAGTELWIAAALLPHPDPSSVTIYSRATEGSGAFAALPTTYNPATGVIETTVDGFSEFATAASDVFSVSVDGQEGEGNDTGFRMLAVPNDVTRASLEDDLDFSTGSGSSSLLQTFPGGDASGEAWQNVTGSGDTIARGQGFILYFFDDAADPVGAGGLQLDVPDSAVDFTQDVTTPALDVNDEYEVLGNPFDQDIDLSDTLPSLPEEGFSANVLIWNPVIEGYVVVTQGLSGDEIPAFNGFVLQRTTPGSGATSLTFAATGRTGSTTPPIGTGVPDREPVTITPLADTPQEDTPQEDTPQADASSTSTDLRRVKLAVEATDGTSTHRSTPQLLVGASGTTTPGWDAYDFGALPPPGDASSYALAGFPTMRGGSAVLRAVASEPTSATGAVEMEVPLHIEGVGMSGTATITWPEGLQTPEHVPADWNVGLVDTRPGDGSGDGSGEVVHDLRTGGAYTFEISGGNRINAPSEARFRLRITTAPLPVELAGFEATRSGEAVALQWQTASETNNAGFHIERRVIEDSTSAERSAEASHVQMSRRDVSTEEADWESLGFIEGAGTTTEPQTYRFEDADLPFEAEQVAYRLRQVDLDGTESVSDERILSAPVPTETVLHAPFPNPAQQAATLRYEVPTQADVQIRIYDLLGRQVTTLHRKTVEAGRHAVQLPTGRLASGTYFVRMTAGDAVQTQRLTVVR